MHRLGLDARDVLAVAGFCALLYGVASWWPPAAWMLGGVLALALAVGPVFRAGGGRPVTGWRWRSKEKRP